MNKKLTCLIVLIIMCLPAGAMAGPYVEPLDFSPITELGRNMQDWAFREQQIEMQRRQIEMQERESQQRMRLLQLEIDRTKQEIESREKQKQQRMELLKRESEMREKRLRTYP